MTTTSAMRPLLSTALALAALLAACGKAEPTDYTPGGMPPGTGGTSSVDGGTPDGGTSDGGTPNCGGDPDGTQGGTSGLVVSEIAWGSSAFLELHNRGPEPLDLSRVQIDGSPALPALQGTLAVGEKTLVRLASLPLSGEEALRIDGDLSSYVCWGTPGPTPLQSAASVAGLWTTPGVCPLQPPPGQSLHLRGRGVFAGDYLSGPPSPLGCQQ